jgi:DNA-damage-inducible protein J
MATEPTSLRFDSEVKAKAYAVFDKIGLKPKQAFDLFLHQVILHEGLPFAVRVPNAETRAAMEELAHGGGTRYQNTQDMFKKLGV